jgi:hypothetical protein
VRRLDDEQVDTGITFELTEVQTPMLGLVNLVTHHVGTC